MRGAAPSIVCPRCELEAPPSDVLGKFTTCTRCKLVFDAAASDRQRPSEKQREEPAEVKEPREVDPSGIHPVLPIVLVLVGLLGIAAFVWASSTEHEPDRGESPQLRMTVLAAHTYLYYAHAGPSCARLGARLQMPRCVTHEAAEAVVVELERMVRFVESTAPADRNEVCEVAVLLIDRGWEGCE